MSSLTRDERLFRADEKLDESLNLSKAAEFFDIPYGTLFTLKKRNFVDIETIGGKNYLDINKKFRTWLEGYHPMSTAGRRALSKGMKKVSERKKLRKGNGLAETPNLNKIPLNHDEREPGYIEPIKLADVQSLSLAGKIAAVNEILRAIADEVNDLQELKEKIRAII